VDIKILIATVITLGGKTSVPLDWILDRKRYNDRRATRRGPNDADPRRAPAGADAAPVDPREPRAERPASPTPPRSPSSRVRAGKPRPRAFLAH
jgi:hypothetical protein